jgi:hypothetical protein
MHKSFLAFLVFCSIISAQDITVSKDSIQVANNPISSFADIVTFTSHSSTSIHLDSVFVLIAEMDTVGIGYAVSHKGLEAGWRSGLPGQMFVWTMDSAGPNAWRLTKKAFSPTNAESLLFSGNGATSQLFALEIGIYLFGEIMPKYTRYIKGTMGLFFSNGQVVELKLYSQDLRTAVKKRELVVKRETLKNGNVRYLANGKKIMVGGKTNLSKSRVGRILLQEKGR